MSVDGNELPKFERPNVGAPPFEEVYTREGMPPHPALHHYAQGVVRSVRERTAWAADGLPTDPLQLATYTLEIAQDSADMGFRFAKQFKDDVASPMEDTGVSAIDPEEAWNGLRVVLGLDNINGMYNQAQKDRVLDYFKSLFDGTWQPPTKVFHDRALYQGDR